MPFWKWLLGKGVKFTWRFSWTGYTKENMPPQWKWFTADEVKDLNAEFVAKLDMARQAAGIAFTITSGFRTPEANQSLIGAVPESAHCKGLAVDLGVASSHEVSRIVQGCLASGIHRIGIYVNHDWQPIHVHVDVDPDKPPEVIFIKQEANHG